MNTKSDKIVYEKCTPSFLQEIEDSIQMFPELELDIRLFRAIAKTLDATIAEELMGFEFNWDNRKYIDNWEREALKLHRPLVQLMKPKMIKNDLKWVFDHFVKTIRSDKVLINTDFALQLNSLSNDLETLKLEQLARLFLNTDYNSLIDESIKFKIAPEALQLTLETVLKPFLVKLFQRLDTWFLTHWKRPTCPVCGKIPNIARINERKMFMFCDLCEGKFWIDYFRCPSCGTDKPQHQQFFYFNDKLDFLIYFCTECKFYWKAIDEDKLDVSIPNGLELFYLNNLDVVAEEEGLTRKLHSR